MNPSEIQACKYLQDQYNMKVEILEGLISRGIKMAWTVASYVHVDNIVIGDDSITFTPSTNYMEECDKEAFTFPYAAFESDIVLFKYFDELMRDRAIKTKQADDAKRLAGKRWELDKLCKELGVKSPIDYL